MADALRLGDAVKEPCKATRSNRIAPLLGSPSFWSVMKRDVPKRLVFVKQQIAEAGFAKPHGVFQYRFKDRLEFTGRRTDDLKHFRGRDLLLLHFTQVARA